MLNGGGGMFGIIGGGPRTIGGGKAGLKLEIASYFTTKNITRSSLLVKQLYVSKGMEVILSTTKLLE